MATKVSSSLIANTAVSPGTYGSATQIPQIVVDNQGRITSATAFAPSVTVDTSIADNSIGNAKLIDATITVTKIADSTITSSKMTNTGVSAGNYGGVSVVPRITVDAQGRVTSAANVTATLTSGQITGALGFTPYSNANPNGYITGINSTSITNALGYTPYSNANPNGYITGITSGNVTSALGYTPYNSTNPSGYITSSGSVATATDVTNALGKSQTYQQVQSIRAFSTNYTNSTSKPIWVWFSSTDARGGSGATTTAYVDGQLACITVMDLYPRNFAGFIVPAGSYYQIQSNSNLAYWLELR